MRVMGEWVPILRLKIHPRRSDTGFGPAADLRQIVVGPETRNHGPIARALDTRAWNARPGLVRSGV